MIPSSCDGGDEELRSLAFLLSKGTEEYEANLRFARDAKLPHEKVLDFFRKLFTKRVD